MTETAKLFLVKWGLLASAVLAPWVGICLLVSPFIARDGPVATVLLGIIVAGLFLSFFGFAVVAAERGLISGRFPFLTPRALAGLIGVASIGAAITVVRMGVEGLPVACAAALTGLLWGMVAVAGYLGLLRWCRLPPDVHSDLSTIEKPASD